MLTVRSRALVVGGLATLSAIFTAQLATAHGPHSAAVNGSSHADDLTEALVIMTGRYQAASGAQRKLLENSLVTAAATRLQALAALMETDPGAVLDAALPAAVRSTLPSSVAPYLEQDANLEGMLEILHDDSPTGTRYQYYLHSQGRRHSLHFADSSPEHLLTASWTSRPPHLFTIGGTTRL
jgi:hypothetical protein